MRFVWFKGRVRKRKRRTRRISKADTVHYETHKEHARAVIHERLRYWNQFYGFAYERVAIKNQRSCWGSCSGKKNLNFNYKIIFLPQILMDYVIVHELCHLAELNHSSNFWSQVARVIPNFDEHRTFLRTIKVVPHTGYEGSMFQTLTQEQSPVLE